jgi:hypothetical protein
MIMERCSLLATVQTVFKCIYSQTGFVATVRLRWVVLATQLQSMLLCEK